MYHFTNRYGRGGRERERDSFGAKAKGGGFRGGGGG